MKKKLSIALCLTAFSHLTYASPLDYYFQQKLHPSTLTKAQADAIQEKYFDQIIDHTNLAGPTFKQRYYVDNSYVQSDKAPIFFEICGEGACEKRALSGNIRHLAEKYHARLVALEHRYYGKSWPTQTASADDLKFLTLDNALKDLAAFQFAVTMENHWQGKWVAFGGSYPGSLSAYYREFYPNNVMGALASSAPVKAQEFFPEYDAHVAKVAGPKCAEKLRDATHEIEANMNNPERMLEIKKMFGAEDVKDNLDFLNLLADISGGAVQYGMHDTMCSILSSANTPLEGYAKGVKLALRMLGLTAVDASVQVAFSEDTAVHSNSVGFRQWFYQSCKEFGYWQIANPDPAKSTRSALLNEEYERGICRRLFGIETKANTDYINSKYYYPLMSNQTSQIYFTNGANDPWSNLSMTAANGNAINPNLHYFTIEKASHCVDLKEPKGSDSLSLQTARAKLDTLIAKWLA